MKQFAPLFLFLEELFLIHHLGQVRSFKNLLINLLKIVER